MKKFRWILLFLLLFYPLSAKAESLFHLEKTKVLEAWKTANENPNITIAVLDTGVDLNHPDLKSNLVPGFNLIDSSKPPLDDNGHGTGVAGILAAKGIVNSTVQGVLKKAKIMPIKVLDAHGIGEAERLAKGIRLAVQRGAKIVLMSLGDPIYSSDLEEAVHYAEEKGVLVIAAGGNDSSDLSYPGAFPTVLSVGAIDRQNQVLSYSNRGPGLDLVAPGMNIKTTTLKGGYKERSGTSFAAPQIAGIAALILKENPSLTPFQLRQVLKTTAEDLGAKGWDRDTGYGLVNAAGAVKKAKAVPADGFEPNQQREQAASLSILEHTQALLSGQDPVDWYRLDVPYDGYLDIQTNQTNLSIELHDSKQKRWTAKQKMKVLVEKGPVYLRITSSTPSKSISYELSTSFAQKEDAYEANDKREQAVKLPYQQSMSMRGNFHKKKDADWFQIAYPKSGQLELEVKVDSLHVDPVLTIEQEGKWKTEIDQGSAGNGQKEQWKGQISPGRIFLQIQDYYGNASSGEYYLNLKYKPFE